MKNILLILLFILASFRINSGGIIPKGTVGETLPAITSLVFGPTRLGGIYEGLADPSSVSTFGNAGAIYQNTLNGEVYIKNDDGSTTNWVPIVGSINSLTDGRIRVGSVTNVATERVPTGELTMDNLGSFTLDNGSVIGKLLTGWTSGSGVVAATDSILQGMQKIDGNVAALESLQDGRLYIGNASNVASEVLMSGEATISNAGAVTLNNDAVTGKVLTGYSQTLGNIETTDSILQAIGKLDYLIRINANSGVISGGGITDNGDGTVNVAALSGFIRDSNSDTSRRIYFNISDTNNIPLVDGDGTYIYVDYNAGTPILATTTTGSTIRNNENDAFEIYEIFRNGSTLHIQDHMQKAANLGKYIQQRLYDTAPIERSIVDGGLILGSASRTVTMSAGALWTKLSKTSISAIDTSGADTFDRYYSNGSGGWTIQTDQTDWDNANYDDGSGTLATISNNRYSCQFFFIDFEGQLQSLYCSGNYVSIADAETESLPSSLPDLISEHSIYIGKIVFQEGVSSPTSVLSAFKGVGATNVPVTDHNSLSGLQGGLVNEYYHLTQDRNIHATDGYYNFLAGKVLSDWSTYDDGAVSTPIDGTGGISANLTLTDSTIINSSDGVLNLTISKGAADAQGEGASVNFSTRGNTDKSRIVNVLISSEESANYADGDLGVYIYDVTNSRILLPNDERIFGSTGAVDKGPYKFQLSTDSTSYRLIFHVKTTNALSWSTTAVIKISEQQIVKGPINTDWKTETGFTFTGAVWNSSSNLTVKTKVNGDTLEGMGTMFITVDPTSAGDLYLQLPSHYAIDTNKISSTTLLKAQLGTAKYIDSSTGTYEGAVNYGGASNLLVFTHNGTGNIGIVNQLNPITFANTDTITFEFKVPLAGRSSNLELSENYSGREITVTATKNTGTHGGAGWLDIDNISKVIDTTGSLNVATGEITLPETGSYLVSVYGELSPNVGTGQRAVAINYDGTRIAFTQHLPGDQPSGGQVTYVIHGERGKKVKGQYYSNAGSASSFINSFISLTKLNSGSLIQAKSEKVYAYYETTAGNAVGTGPTIIDYGTKIEDSHNAVTTGSSWRFTAPKTGKATISFYNTMNLISLSTAQRIVGDIFLNGARHKELSRIYGNGSSIYHTVWGTITLNLNRGDYIDIRLNSSLAGTLYISNDNWITITME